MKNPKIVVTDNREEYERRMRIWITMVGTTHKACQKFRGLDPNFNIHPIEGIWKPLDYENS